MSEWFDVNKVPADGLIILVFINEQEHIAYWDEFLGNYFIGIDNGCDECSGMTKITDITYWRPWVPYPKPEEK